MLTRIPGVNGYIETSRVSRIDVELGYVKVMDGQDKMLARGFHSQEEADAWAGEVAKIVNEATKTSPIGFTPFATGGSGGDVPMYCGGGGGSSHEVAGPGSCGAPPSPSFSDWQPTLEQVAGALGLYDSEMGPMASFGPTIARKWLSVWQRVFSAQAKGQS